MRSERQYADRPDVGRLGRQRAGKAFRRDVGERPGHVALRGQGLGLLDLGEAEVEHLRRETPRPSASRTFDGLTSRWTIPRPCACARASRIWAQASIADASSSSPLRKRLAEGPARHVLVGDVDVLRVAAEPVGALAGRMAQARGGLGLPLGSGRRLPLPRHDLEGHVEPVLLVAGKPDRAGTAAPQRPQRPVAAEDELALDKGWGCVRHRLSRVGGGADKSFTRRERREVRVRVNAASAVTAQALAAPP